ncbi:MAG: hypothetical protein Q8L10_00695, partial [Candidatus Moranbacteria bacterium]|nr:hypothetical protein [Candidatus Moranbacteria bacterium]
EDDKAPQVSLGLASGEKRSFYFVIPKALTPQAYDAVLELTDKQGKIISNKLSFHYVLRGASATIQNLRLDKDYYLKGETARASIYWTPAADNFYGARFAPTDNGKVFLEIAIKSAAGNLCTEKYDKEADPGARTSDYDLPVTSNCVDPRIIVSIKDGQGNILDQKEYALKSQDVPVGAGLEKEEVQKEDEKYDPIFLYASILGAILAIALLAVVFHRRKSVSLFIFFILGTAIFAHGNNASAATFVVQSINYSHSDSVYTVNLNKSVFLPGENITAYGTGKGGVCRNGDLFQYLAVSSTDGTNSVSKPIIDIYADAGHWFVANGTQDWQCTGDSGRFSHQICNYITNGHIKFASSGTDGNHRVVFLGKGWGSHAYLPVRYNVTGKACTLPWGGTIASGKSVTAYKSNLLPCGSTCVKQTRTCNNGKLSGSYINKNCSVQACAAPVLNFSATPTSVTSGTATTLTWSTKNVSGNCYGTSNVANDGGWTPNNAVSTDRSSKSGSGATQSVSPTATTTYALECWNGAGVSAKKTVTVSVASPAPANPCASIDPIAGRCGVADGQAYLTAPASNLLCSSGNPSPASLSGSGPWNWTCNGICSTSNASCSASQSVDLNWKEVNPN